MVERFWEPWFAEIICWDISNLKKFRIFLVSRENRIFFLSWLGILRLFKIFLWILWPWTLCLKSLMNSLRIAWLILLLQFAVSFTSNFPFLEFLSKLFRSDLSQEDYYVFLLLEKLLMPFFILSLHGIWDFGLCLARIPCSFLVLSIRCSCILMGVKSWFDKSLHFFAVNRV